MRTKILTFALTLAGLFTADCDAQDPKVNGEKPAIELPITLRCNGKDVLTYQAGYLESPDKDAPWFGRSGFIHPFLTPNGNAVTEPFPEDHYHQHGLMFAWTSSVINSKKVDFWNSRKQQGHIEHVKTIEESHGRLIVQLAHVNDRSSKPKTVIAETWKIDVVDHESVHAFDLVSTQEVVTNKSVEIEKYHYGAMCVRGPSAWLDNTKMLTSDDKTQENGNHSRPRWVAMTGSDESFGIVAMSHPDNFRSPQHVRLHPNKPYFCFAPMVEAGFELTPASPYLSKFRFIAFDGKLPSKVIERLWEDFVSP